MAILDFPLNPQNGDIYNANGRSWIYDSATGSWKSNNVLRTLGIVNGGTGLSSINAGDAFLSSNSSGTALTYRTFIAGTNMSISIGASSVTFSSTGSGGGGAGTVEQGLINSIPYYPSSGTLVTGSSNFTNIPGSGVSIINPDSNSSSTTTGALVIYGGLGVTGNAFIGGTVTASTFTGSFIGNASSATYSNQSGYASTAGYATTSGLATSSNYSNAVNAVNTSADFDHPLLFTKETSTTTTGAAVSFDSGVTFNPTGNLLKLGSGQLSASGVTIGSANDTISTAANDLIITSATGNVKVDNNLTVSGNLTINGTTTSIGSTITTLLDPVFVLGAGNGGTNPTVDDNKDRGIEFRYFSGTAKTGFFGFDDSTGYFTFIPDATNNDEIFSGTAGTAQFTTVLSNLIGNVTGTATTATTSTNVSILGASTNTFHPVLFTPSQSSSGSAISANGTLVYNPATDSLYSAGLFVTGSGNAVSFTQGALTVTGGIAASNIFINNRLTVAGVITSGGTATSRVEAFYDNIGSFGFRLFDGAANHARIEINRNSFSNTYPAAQSEILGIMFRSATGQTAGIGFNRNSSANLSLFTAGASATGRRAVRRLTILEGSDFNNFIVLGDNESSTASTSIIKIPDSDQTNASGNEFIIQTGLPTGTGLPGTLRIRSANLGSVSNATTSTDIHDVLRINYIKNAVSATSSSASLFVSGGLALTGNAFIGGTVVITDTTTSTSTTSGALVVSGGVGIIGNLYVGGSIVGNLTGTATTAQNLNTVSFTAVSPDQYLLVSSVNGGSGVAVSSGSALSYSPSSYTLNISGLGLSSNKFSSTSTTLNLFNDTVTTIDLFKAGTAISVGSGQGTITLNSSNVLINQGTASTSTSTGALIVSGGVGIGGSIYVSGSSQIDGITVSSGTVYGNLSGTATTAQNVHMNSTTENSQHKVIFSIDNNPAGNALSYNSTLVYNPGTDILTTSGMLITSTTKSTSSGTGALIVYGGIGVSDGLFTSPSFQSNISGLAVSNQVISTGTWAGSTISYDYGGTGYNSYSQGDLLVGDGAGDLQKFPVGSDNSVLVAKSISSFGMSWLPILDPVYGAFASTTSQTVGSANGTTVISFDTFFAGNGITITPIGAGLARTTRIYFNEGGIFNIQFSAQLNLTNATQTQQGEIWFRKNGLDVPTSNTRINVPGKDLESVLTVNFVDTFIPTDFIELAMYGETFDFGIGAFPIQTSTHTAPAIPSIITTVTPVSGTLPGSGIAISGIAQINNQTGASQTLVTGSSGSDFNISSSSNVHTFNLPDAGTSSRGVINFSSQTIAGAKTFSNDLVVSSGTSSIDSLTGALVVTGGVGIGGSLYVSGTASSISGLIIDSSVIKSGSWAGSTITMSYGGTGYASNSKGDILVGTGESWYKLSYSASANDVLTVDTTTASGLKWAQVPPSSASSVAVKATDDPGTRYLTFVDSSTGSGLFLSTDTTLSYDASTNTLTTGTFVGNLTGTATTSTNVSISSASTNIFHPVLFTPSQSSSGSAISSNGTLVYNPATDSLYSAGLFVTGSGNAVSFTQGALTVTGGIAASNIFINNRVTVSGFITSGGTATSRVETYYDSNTNFGLRIFNHTQANPLIELGNSVFGNNIYGLRFRAGGGASFGIGAVNATASALALYSNGLIKFRIASTSLSTAVVSIGPDSDTSSITSILRGVDNTSNSGNFIITPGQRTGAAGTQGSISLSMPLSDTTYITTALFSSISNASSLSGVGTAPKLSSVFIYGGLAVTGNALIGGTVGIFDSTNSTTTSSGALRVDGGVAIGQSVSVGGRIQLFNGANYTAFISAATADTVYLLPATTPVGTANSVLQSTPEGVLSWVPMTATGGANIGYTVFDGNNFELAYYFQNGTGVTGAQYIHNVGTGMSLLYGTDSSSTSTGALVVRGGVGITGNLYVGGSIVGNLTGTATTAKNTNLVLDLDATGNHPIIFTPSNTTVSGGAQSFSTFVYVQPSEGVIHALQFSGGLTGDVLGNVTGTATSSRNVFAVDGSSDTRNHYLLSSPSQSGSGVAVSTDSNLYIVPSTNTLFLSSGSLFAGTSISTPLISSSDRITLQTSIGQTDAIRILAGNSGASGTFVAFDTFNKRVGLGISTPVYTLDVVGDINASSGQSFRIGGTVVLNSTTLGTGVTNSSLQSLGTIRTGVWAATAITAHYGGTGLQTPFAIGDILFANTTTTLSRLAAVTGVQVLTSNGINSAPQYVAQSTLSVGSATTAANTNLVITSASGTHPITFTPSTTTVSGGAQSFNTNVFVTPSTGTITASVFSGPLTGNVTGDVTGNLTGTATTATNINSVAGAADTAHYLLFSLRTNGTGIAVSSGTGLSFNPATTLLGVRKLSVFDTTNSTSSSTGALIVTGGVGVGQSVSIGGRLTVSSSLNSSSTNTGAIVNSGGLGMAGNAFIGGTVTLSDATNSTSSATGALIVTGGVGVGQSVSIGGRLTVSSSLNSSSTATGAIVNSGGLGMAGNAFIGGTVVITNTTNSSTINSGALEIDGGVGVGQSVSIGGRLQIFNGTNTGFAAFRYTGAGNTVYTLPNNAPVGTAASFLSSDVNGNLNWIAPPTGTPGSATPGGSDTFVQFNDGGSFGGTTFFTYSKSINQVSLGSSSSIGNSGLREVVLRLFNDENPDWTNATRTQKFSPQLEFYSKSTPFVGGGANLTDQADHKFRIYSDSSTSDNNLSKLHFTQSTFVVKSGAVNPEDPVESTPDQFKDILVLNSYHGVGVAGTAATNVNYFRTSNTQSSDKTYILPTDYPATGTSVLSSDTTGTLSWVASSGGPGGSGTVNSGTAGSIAFYAADGTAVSASSNITIFAGSGVSVNSNLNVRAGNQLRISNSGNNYTAIVANNTIGANFTLTLPSAAPSGTASSFLSADTSGNLFFIAPPSGGTSKQIHRIQLAAGYNPTLGADNAVFMIPFSYTDGTSSVTYNLRRVDCRVETTSSSGGAGSTSTFNIEKYAYNTGAGIYTFSTTSTGSTTNIMTLPLPIGGAGVAETFWTLFNPGTVVSGDKLRLNFSSITALHTNFSISLIMEQN